jgi:hypothetical protein
MSSDWWSRQLSSPNATPQRSAPSVPPTSPPLRFPPQAPQQQAPIVHQQQPMGNPQGETTIGVAIRSWAGGEAHRKEGNLTCPECGSIHVFSRTASGTTINGSSQAPRCFECGWNGRYDQGSQSSWIA